MNVSSKTRIDAFRATTLVRLSAVLIGLITAALVGCVTATRNVTLAAERCCATRVDVTGKITERAIEQKFVYDVGRYGFFVGHDASVDFEWGTQKDYGYYHIFRYFLETPGGSRSELRFLECIDHESPIIIRAVQETNLWVAIKEDAVFVFDHSGMIHRRKLKMRQYPKPHVVFALENRTFTYRDYQGATNTYCVLEDRIQPTSGPK